MKILKPALVLILMILAFPSFSDAQAAAPAAAQSIRLNDGTVLRGSVVSENDSTVTVRTEELGLVTIKRNRITLLPVRDTSVVAVRAPVDPDPIGHALVLMPTAFTPSKGSLVFRDFELLFLTLGYSPTASTSIVAGAMFPVTTEFNAFTLGIKQGVYQTANQAIAVVGNVTVPVGTNIDGEGFLWLLNAVGSYRFKPGFGVHGAVGGVGVQGRGASEQSLSLAAGTDVRVGPYFKLLGEVLRGGTTFDPGSSLTLVNVGVRIHGERLSADIAAMRPVGADFSTDLLFIPLINVGYRF